MLAPAATSAADGDNPSAADMDAKGKAWVQRWTKTVLK